MKAASVKLRGRRGVRAAGFRWVGCPRPRASLLAEAVELKAGAVWRHYLIRRRFYRMWRIEASRKREVWQVLAGEKRYADA